jgi:hypothetical protein
MNNSGKERLASEIANLAANILLKHEVVISLGWKNDQEDSVNNGSNEDSISLREEPKDSSVQHAAPKYDTFF